LINLKKILILKSDVHLSHTELYLLRLDVFGFFQTLSLDSVSDKAGIHGRMLLKGNLQHKIKGTVKIYLREGSGDSAAVSCRQMERAWAKFKERVYNYNG
jgi:hypothetical protein